MARRVLALITTLPLDDRRPAADTASAGFLFSAMLHRFGTHDWMTFTAIALGLAAAGAVTIGSGVWLAFGVGRAGDLEPDDDAMWLT